MMYFLGVLTGSVVTMLSFAVYKIFNKSNKRQKYEASIKVGQNYHSGIVSFRELN